MDAAARGGPWRGAAAFASTTKKLESAPRFGQALAAPNRLSGRVGGGNDVRPGKAAAALDGPTDDLRGVHRGRGAPGNPGRAGPRPFPWCRICPRPGRAGSRPASARAGVLSHRIMPKKNREPPPHQPARSPDARIRGGGGRWGKEGGGCNHIPEARGRTGPFSQPFPKSAVRGRLNVHG